MIFRDSKLAHRYLDDLVGIEIGASAHNPFNLPNCINVDYTDAYTGYKHQEVKMCGHYASVDVVADGADLPFEDESYDYVISSHVIEHFFDPIAAIKEWFRIIKPGGYIYIIAPRQFALPSETRECTLYTELVDRHSGKMKKKDVNMRKPINEHGHWSVWNLKEFMDLCDYMKWVVVKNEEFDDKVGNGFTVIIQKI